VLLVYPVLPGSAMRSWPSLPSAEGRPGGSGAVRAIIECSRGRAEGGRAIKDRALRSPGLPSGFKCITNPSLQSPCPIPSPPRFLFTIRDAANPNSYVAAAPVSNPKQQTVRAGMRCTRGGGRRQLGVRCEGCEAAPRPFLGHADRSAWHTNSHGAQAGVVRYLLPTKPHHPSQPPQCT
jgi:hypothetical protein